MNGVEFSSRSRRRARSVASWLAVLVAGCGGHARVSRTVSPVPVVTVPARPVPALTVPAPAAAASVAPPAIALPAGGSVTLRADGVHELRAAPALTMRRRDGAGWTRVVLGRESACGPSGAMGPAGALRWSFVGPDGEVSRGTMAEFMGRFTEVRSGGCAAWVPDALLHALAERPAPLYVGQAEVSATSLRAFLGAPPAAGLGVESSTLFDAAGARHVGRMGEVEYTIELVSSVPPPPDGPAGRRLRIWLTGPTAMFGAGTPSLSVRGGRREATLPAVFGEGQGERYRWLFTGPADDALAGARTLELRIGQGRRMPISPSPLLGLAAACDGFERTYSALEGGLDTDVL